MKHKVSEVTLRNGAKGLFIHIPDASVMTFDINFRAGDFLVPREKWEAPHIMEHMLFGANQLIPKARAFQAEFEKNGAYCNASVDTYDITYEVECADFEWDRIVDLARTAIDKPLFKEDEFAAEFGNVREELSARGNNHFRHLSLALRGAYGFHALTDQERLGLMDNVHIGDVKTHYDNTHTTSNMRFVIAGKLPATRQKLITSLLEDIEIPRGDGRMEPPTERPKALRAPLYIHNESVENLYFYIDTFMRRRTTEDESDALNLINTMLTETLYSRILGTARERGLLYSMSSGFGNYKEASNWWFGAQVMPKNALELFKIIAKEINDVRTGRINNDDIIAAKQYSLGRFQRSAQTVSGTASGYNDRYFFDGYIDDYYQIPSRIEAVTKQGIVDIANAQFADRTWGMGCLGSSGNDFVLGLQAEILPLWGDN